jgi:hypothetical protein
MQPAPSRNTLGVPPELAATHTIIVFRQRKMFILNHALVKLLRPVHDGTRKALHRGQERMLKDERDQDHASIRVHRPPTAEAFDQRDIILSHMLQITQAFRLSRDPQHDRLVVLRRVVYDTPIPLVRSEQSFFDA